MDLTHGLDSTRLGRDAELLRRSRHDAVYTTCAFATDATDAAYLLDVLGLDPREGTDDPPDLDPTLTSVARRGVTAHGTRSYNDPPNDVGVTRRRRPTREGE